MFLMWVLCVIIKIITVNDVKRQSVSEWSCVCTCLTEPALSLEVLSNQSAVCAA